MNTVNWAELQPHHFQLLAGTQAVTLLLEAFGLLESPNPDERDGLAYPALATWLEEGHLDGHLLEWRSAHKP